MNFETHYLSHCRVIPLKSFGSHIRPQPHGLGLIVEFPPLLQTVPWKTLCLGKLTTQTKSKNINCAKLIHSYFCEEILYEQIFA
jgi:hypothetical protein